MAGKFIVIEGIDGAGTTTQTARLVNRIRSVPTVDAVATAEPTTGPIGLLIRQILQRKIKMEMRTGELNQQALTLLFAADRLDHVETIKGYLDHGVHVVCDRYSPSTYSYQGVKVDARWIQEVDGRALDPDVVILLVIPAERAFDRITKRQEDLEVFEKVEYLKKVSGRYHDAMNRYPSTTTVVKIDGTQAVDDIADEIWDAVAPLLPVYKEKENT